MIHEEKCYTATCDNCGEPFVTYHTGWSMFSDKSSIIESMDNEDWYIGHLDEYNGKHYCPSCFKYHPTEDDKIIVDVSRKSPNK